MNVPKLRFSNFSNDYEIKEIADITYNVSSGKISKQLEDGQYNVYGSMGVIGKSNFYDYTGEKVLVARVGANAGSVSKINENCCISDNTLVLEPKNILNDYLYYSLSYFNPKKLIFGSGQPLVTGTQIKKIKLSIPKKEEQLKVAKFLSLLDKKIELQTKKIEDLKLFKLYIRNKIFSGIKTKDKIINTLNYEQPNRYIVKSDDYLNDENLIPVLTANKAFILGYCNEDDYYNKGDVIIFDDFTMDSKYVNFNFKIKSSAIKLLTQKNNNNLKYIFECLQALNLESTEHKRHYISIVQEIEIPVPDIIVQNKIANLMFMYDKKIKLESDNYNKLIELKKGLMQNMFV